MESLEPTTRPTGEARDYPVKPVPFTDVATDDLFWTPRIETNRTVTIPFAFRQCETSGRVDLFERAAAALRGDEGVDIGLPSGKSAPGYPFDDTDLYKVLEAAGYVLSVQPDPELEAYVDRLVELIAQAQEPDGYLYTTRTIDPEHPHPWAGSNRWELERVNSHELYNLGHLYEAAVAYWQATGKREILDVAIRSADLLSGTFGPGKESIWPGHQITEMALVKLARATGNARYIELAAFMIDRRGPDGLPGSGREYNQSHRRVVEQAEAVGHAVRAGYMYSGIADVAAMTGSPHYIETIERIWQDVVTGKLYITGGIGARHDGEAFGNKYELPNRSAYCETCAAISNVFWNHRLFLLQGDGRYVDVLERSLYNGVLSGVSLDGMSFFYANPLDSEGGYERSPWFGCACCPSNIARFIPSLPGYVYAQNGNTLFVNLYVGSTAEIRNAYTAKESGGSVSLTQETRYPWDGKVKLTVDLASPGTFTLKLRIPGWARDEVVPGDLYRFVDSAGDSAGDPVTLKVNGEAVRIELDKGYVTLEREWRSGDAIELYLPMPVRRVVAHEQVEENRGKVALERGPLVFCLEGADNKNGQVHNIALRDDAPLRAEFASDLLEGVVVIKGQALSRSEDQAGNEQGSLQGVENNQDFMAVPYHVWANRNAGEMVVWIPRKQSKTAID